MLLEIANLHKSFGPISVLHGVDLGLHAGEVLALVGDNGAGKSTLIKHVAGVYKQDSGDIRLNGTKLDLHAPADARHLGIETVYKTLPSPTTCRSARTSSSAANRSDAGSVSCR